MMSWMAAESLPMSVTEEEKPGWKRALAAAGRGGAVAGRFVASKAVAAYRAVDPDVQRHIVQLPLLSYSLLFWKGLAVEAGIPDGHPPLVFVHGMGGSRGDFAPMAFYLRRAGRRRAYHIQFPGHQTLEERAEMLAAYVGEVTRATGEPKVDLVAHSMGGVAARLAIVDHGMGALVKPFITLGTPHGGTYPARYGNTTNTRMLRPDSELITRLNSHRLSRRIRGVTFWSRNDLLILPPESAALEGTRQVELTPSTHYGYLINPRAWRAVQEALEGHSG